MDLLFLVSTRLDLLRAARLQRCLPGHSIRLAAYLRKRTAFGMPDLGVLGLSQVVSWLVPAKETTSSRAAEAMTWAQECLQAKRPDLLVVGEISEAALPLAITMQKAGVALACLEAGMPAPAHLHPDRVVVERLACFRFSPMGATTAALQEQGLECQLTGDLLAEAHLLLSEGTVAQTLRPLGLNAGRYTVVALDAAKAVLPASSGAPCVRVPGAEGEVQETEALPALPTESITQWLALLTGAGCVVSDNLGVCRVAAGAGTGAVLLATQTERWCEEVAIIAAPGDPSWAVLQTARVSRNAVAGDAGEEIARILTEGA